MSRFIAMETFLADVSPTRFFTCCSECSETGWLRLKARGIKLVLALGVSGQFIFIYNYTYLVHNGELLFVCYKF